MKKTIMIMGFLAMFMVLVGLSTPEISFAGWQPFTDTF
jgi:hypothetical protein